MENNLPDGFIENALEVSLGESRTFEILVGFNFLGANQRLLVRHGLHALLAKTLEGFGVLTKIELGADEDDGDVGRMMVNLGVPLRVTSMHVRGFERSQMSVSPYLGLNVVERGGADDGEANQEDVGLGVGERSKSIVIFLSSGIPETKTDRLSVDHNACGIVIKSASMPS